MTSSRRGFLMGLGGLIVAAPAIVRATSLMPIKVPAEFETIIFDLEAPEGWVYIRPPRPLKFIQLTFKETPYKFPFSDGAISP